MTLLDIVQYKCAQAVPFMFSGLFVKIATTVATLEMSETIEKNHGYIWC